MNKLKQQFKSLTDNEKKVIRKYLDKEVYNELNS